MDGDIVSDDLASPVPWFGGKSRAAPIIWRALGKVSNLVDPFFGSGAVLLSRPRSCWATPDNPGTETVNDLSRMVSNFWRALSHDPDAVARWCDFPVVETDLHARHRWLMTQLASDFGERMAADPGYFDAKIAGWWAWGACAWIGSGWCDETKAPGAPLSQQLPHMSRDQGINRRALSQQLPYLGGGDGGTGRGINRKALSEQLPHLGNAGRGLHRKLPHLGDAGRGEALRAYLHALAARTRGVRVACGDWKRVTGDSVTWRHGLTGVVLDPPYAEGNQQYAAGGTGTNVSADARKWALEAGQRPDMRVVLCGLEGEHDMPASWRCVPWKARGGYGSQGDGTNDNRLRERLWLSPACCDVSERQRSLF